MSRWVRKFGGFFRGHLAVAAVAVAGMCAGNAYAATFTFDNATLNLDELTSAFSLSTADWTATYGPNAFIGSVAVDLSGSSSGVGVASGSVSGGGVAAVSVAPGSGPGGAFDFRFNLGSGGSSDRLTGLETVNWQASGLTGQVTNVALHVQGLSTDSFPGGSLWVFTGNNAAAPIPEPSTYALFVLGLIGLGFMMRKKLKGASPLAGWA